MEPPQPAFDLLTSLPIDRPIEEWAFVDWFAYGRIEAGPEDALADHPEAWEYIGLPNILKQISEDEYVSIQPFDGELNLNAIAIGLGLEEIRYEPEEFSGLVWEPADHTATALAFPTAVILGIGETPGGASEVIDHALERLDALGLADQIELETQQTMRVDDIV